MKKMVKPSKSSARRHTTICQMRGHSLDSGYDQDGEYTMKQNKNHKVERESGLLGWG